MPRSNPISTRSQHFTETLSMSDKDSHQPCGVSNNFNPTVVNWRDIVAWHCVQVAGFTDDCSYDTVFQIVAPDPAHRIASEGVPVLAHVPLCIQHCATSALMNLTDASYPNEFAADRELTFHTTRSSGKKALLHHENRGNLTGTIASKHSDPNFFVFLTGSKIEELPSAMYGSFCFLALFLLCM